MSSNKPFWPRVSPHFLACRRGVRAAGLDHAVAVGLSGGADSLALLAALVAEGHEVLALCVDHGLQDGSRAQARILDRAINKLRQQPGREPIIHREPGIVLNVDTLDVESLLPQHLERGLRIAFKAGFLATGHRQLTRNGFGHDVIGMAHHFSGAVR